MVHFLELVHTLRFIERPSLVPVPNMFGGRRAEARALACCGAAMAGGGRGPVAGRIDAQHRPEEAGRRRRRVKVVFETRAAVGHLHFFIFVL